MGHLLHAGLTAVGPAVATGVGRVPVRELAECVGDIRKYERERIVLERGACVPSAERIILDLRDAEWMVRDRLGRLLNPNKDLTN